MRTKKKMNIGIQGVILAKKKCVMFLFSTGDYATVYKGNLNDNGFVKTVAIKTMISAATSERHRFNLLSEAEILAQLHHQNILHFEGIIVQPQQTSIVTQCARYGSLDSFLRVGLCI
jgi:serine/threonine protein kinase